jgi:hypothetical protein
VFLLARAGKSGFPGGALDLPLKESGGARPVPEAATLRRMAERAATGSTPKALSSRDHKFFWFPANAGNDSPRGRTAAGNQRVITAFNQKGQPLTPTV